MAEISVNMDFYEQSAAFRSGDWSRVEEQLLGQRFDCAAETGTGLVGAQIRVNEPLSKLYGFPVRLVDFSALRFETLSRADQARACRDLFTRLKERMDAEPAYYTMRVPADMVDLLRAFNEVFSRTLFCGGTVMYVGEHGTARPEIRTKARSFLADRKFIEEHRGEMTALIAETFENFRGQYHLSPVLHDGAGQIYSEWIDRAFDNEAEVIAVATYQGEVAALHSLGVYDRYVSGILGGASDRYRRIGAYKAVIGRALEFCDEQELDFLIGTQMDNYVVQGVWGGFGLKPFFSFYNIHYTSLRISD